MMMIALAGGLAGDYGPTAFILRPNKTNKTGDRRYWRTPKYQAYKIKRLIPLSLRKPRRAGALRRRPQTPTMN